MSFCRRLVPIVALAVALPIQPRPLASESFDEVLPGLGSRFASELAAQAESYRSHRADFASVETLRGATYRLPALRRVRVPPGLLYDDETTPEYRLRLKAPGHFRRRLPRKLKSLPVPHDWAMLFSAENQPFFLFRDLGERLEGFDLIREVRFRGALPFAGGRDIREWEGLALVEARRFRIVEIRARPRDQPARLSWLFDRWSRAVRITFGIPAGPFFIPGPSLRLARRPLAYRCFVRFDDRRDDLWMPTLMSYEIRQAISPERTALRSLSTRYYSHARVDRPPAGFNSLRCLRAVYCSP